MTRANLILATSRQAAYLLGVLAILTLALSMPGRASAQGPGEGSAGPFVLVEESDAGQYHVKVWQSPERLVVSSVQIVVELTDQSTGEPIDDAEMWIYGIPSAVGEDQKGRALSIQSGSPYYQANIYLKHAGLWAFDIEITNGPFGSARITHSAEVHERTRSGSSLALGTLMFALVGLAFAGGIGYLVWSGRRNRRQMSAQGS